MHNLQPYKVPLASGDAVWFIGGYVSLLTHAKDTGGKLGLTEWIGPKGMGAPPHSHTLEAEGFYILEGDVTVKVCEKVFHAHRGDFVYVPKGAPHEFLVTSATSKFLVTITPAGFEEFFRDLSDGPAKVATWPSDGGTVPPIERVIAAGEKYGWRPEVEAREIPSEISARVFNSASGAGLSFPLAEAVIRFKATRRQTEDNLSISEWSAPQSWELQRIAYELQSTTYYGLDGMFRIETETESFEVRAGDNVFVPPQTVHSIRAESASAQMLVIANDSAIEELGNGPTVSSHGIAKGKPVDQSRLREVGNSLKLWSFA